MANHVYFHIDCDSRAEDFNNAFKSEEVETQWGKRIEFLSMEHQPFYNHVDKTFDKDGWLEGSFDWYCNNVGAKWIDVEEANDGFVYGHSAWSPPIAFVENLVQYLSNISDSDINATMTYEDEFRNFVGKVYVSSAQNEDGSWIAYAGDPIETDGDELMEQMLNDYPFLRKEYEGDDFDWFELYKDKESKEEVCPSELMDDYVHNFMENN